MVIVYRIDVVDREIEFISKEDQLTIIAHSKTCLPRKEGSLLSLAVTGRCVGGAAQAIYIELDAEEIHRISSFGAELTRLAAARSADEEGIKQ